MVFYKIFYWEELCAKEISIQNSPLSLQLWTSTVPWLLRLPPWISKPDLYLSKNTYAVASQDWRQDEWQPPWLLEKTLNLWTWRMHHSSCEWLSGPNLGAEAARFLIQARRNKGPQHHTTKTARHDYPQCFESRRKKPRRFLTVLTTDTLAAKLSIQFFLCVWAKNNIWNKFLCLTDVLDHLDSRLCSGPWRDPCARLNDLDLATELFFCFIITSWL